MEARAVEKYIRMSPRKIKYVIDMIKSKPLDEAIDILSFTNRRAARAIKKAIECAVANALDKFKELKITEDDLYLKDIYVTDGPTLKRWKPRARGRADRLLKRTAHITVIVADIGKDEDEPKNKKDKKKEAKV